MPRQRSRSSLVSFWREILPPSVRRPHGLLEVPSIYPVGTAIGTQLPKGATQKTACTRSLPVPLGGIDVPITVTAELSSEAGDKTPFHIF